MLPRSRIYNQIRLCYRKSRVMGPGRKCGLYSAVWYSGHGHNGTDIRIRHKILTRSAQSWVRISCLGRVMCTFPNWSLNLLLFVENLQMANLSVFFLTRSCVRRKSCLNPQHFDMCHVSIFAFALHSLRNLTFTRA